MARVSVFLIVLALIAGMAGCGGDVTRYDLTISSTAGGSVTTPGEGTFSYTAGRVVNLVAASDAGYRFVNWTGDVGTIADANATTTTITMNGDYSITANFVAVYDLTISSTEGGSVTTPGEGTFTYDEGTVVNLVATPDAGYHFVNWTGDVDTIGNVNAAITTITMDDNYSITANFGETLTNISVESGLSVVNIPIGGSSNIAYVVNFATESSQGYTIQFAQSCSPDNAGISLTTDYPPGWMSNTLMTWIVNQIIQGHIIGTYEITTMAMIVETGQIDEVITIVNVISDEQIPILGPLSSDPDAIPISTPSSVLFTTMLSGSDLAPTDIVVEEVDALGNSIATLGGIFDDGSAGDLQSNDYVYSGTFDISSDVEGELFFRAKASFPGIMDPVYSSVSRFLVSRFPTDLRPPDMTKIIADPQTGDDILSNEVMVSFTEGLDPATIELIVNSIGGSVVGTILGLGYYQIEIPDTGDTTGVYNAINNLVSNPKVRTAEPVGIVYIAAVTPSDTRFSSQWGLTKIRADEAWVNIRGFTTIAVVDSGVDYGHEDLWGKIIKGRNLLAWIFGRWDPKDDFGHGTHVAGIAAAETNNSVGISGVSWDSKILAVKVVDATGHGADSTLAKGIKHAADQGAKVINVSLGGYYPYSCLKDAVDYATSKGALVVASAGNERWAIPKYPAAYPNVLSVGATDLSDGRWADFDKGSNFGNWVRIAAPGTSILSTMPIYDVTMNNPPFNYSHNYTSMSGTSMASPMVAGAAAVLWSKHPSWTAAQVRERLEKTAKPLPGLQLGAGRIDLFEAVFNGSFEIGDLSEWTWTGTASSLTSLGPLLPQEKNGHKNRMGYVSTGPSGDMVWSSLDQFFRIQPDITSLTISFDYNFVTEEYPEWVGTSYNDALTICIETPGGNEITLAEEYVNSSSFSLVGGINFPGGDNTVGMTGWKSVSKTIDVTEGFANFKIYITDAGDDIYDSVVLIDNIRFK